MFWPRLLRNNMYILEPGRKPRKAPFLQSVLSPFAELQSSQIPNYLSGQPRSKHAYLKVPYYSHLRIFIFHPGQKESDLAHLFIEKTKQLAKLLLGPRS